MKKLISYIFPIYNESGNIDLLYSTLKTLLDGRADYVYEVIFINDGSKDDSLDKILAIQKKDNNVVVIDFARNYGHQIAVTAGLDYAKGDAVIIMDSDMQDPPAISFELIAKWEEGFDVVYAQRRTRQDSPFKRFTAAAFYRLLNKLSDIDIPRDTGDFRLLDRKVVDELKKFKEHDRFLRGMVSYVGFKQVAVLFDRAGRHEGVTGYPIKKMIRFAADGITGFSTTPLKLIRYVGLVIALFTFLGALYALVLKIISPDTVVQGWTFIVMSILFIGGIQLIMLSVLGSYIGRIYNEVKGRPLYGVANVFKDDQKK